MTFEEIKKAVDEENTKARKSAWNKGVAYYSYELLDNIKEALLYSEGVLDSTISLKKAMLNGADTWTQYSWGGSSLVYDGDIAQTLCSPSELKRCKGGDRRPNAHEEWLDVQARALYCACSRITRAYNRIKTRASV